MKHAKFEDNPCMDILGTLPLFLIEPEYDIIFRKPESRFYC